VDYFISFLAVALFPFALGAYGGHLAAIVLNGKQKTRALWIVWSLASAGVLMAAIQQYNSYRTDKDHDSKQLALQGKLDSSLLSQARMGGQLDSIGLMIGKMGEKSGDPGLRTLASAVSKLADYASKTNTPANAVPSAPTVPSAPMVSSDPEFRVARNSLATTPYPLYGKNAAQFIITPNTVMSGARGSGAIAIAAKCTGKLSKGVVERSLGVVNVMGAMLLDEHTLRIDLSAGNWYSDSPLTITIYSYEDLGMCSFKRISQ
jgi:hypothetical protein